MNAKCLPTTEEALVLQQRPVDLLDWEFGRWNVICPYLVGRVVFEPWIDFDENVQETKRIVREKFGKDDCAIHSVQSALGRMWTAVDGTYLANSVDVERLFPAVFDVVRSIVRIVDEKAPPLSCDDRVILPPHGVPKPQALPAKNCVMIDAKDWDARTPCLCVTSSHTTMCFYTGAKSKLPLLPRCAQAMSDRWNAVLSKDADPADMSSSEHQVWILQAVTEAMYAHSGCAVLWNYRSVIAVRVGRFETAAHGGRDQIRVQVSSMYTDGQAENAMFGLISALQIAVKSALSKDKDENLRLCREILCKSTHCLVLTDEIYFSKGPSKWVSDSMNAEVSFDENISSEEYCWISSRAVALFKRELDERIDIASLAPEFFKHVLSTYSRVMYAGEDSSVLLLGCLGNVPVVTKYANTNMCFAPQMLQRETDMYNLIRKDHVELLGNCVPDVLAICRQPRCDPVLVVEYVGHPVTRDRDGRVMAGGSSVSELDWIQIVAAANRGLDCLARAGLSHGDETISNIRAERLVQNAAGEQGGLQENEKAWRVWWIDFGLGKKLNGTQKIEDKWYEKNVSIEGQCTFSNLL